MATLQDRGRRVELVHTRAAFRDGTAAAGLLAALEARYPATYRDGFLVGVIPEQGEDIYQVLIGRDLVTIEIDRARAEVLEVEVESVDALLKRKIGRDRRRTLLLALAIAAEG